MPTLAWIVLFGLAMSAIALVGSTTLFGTGGDQLVQFAAFLIGLGILLALALL